MMVSRRGWGWRPHPRLDLAAPSTPDKVLLINRDLLSTSLMVGKVGCVCVWCVCVLSVHLFQDDLRCLFSPHQVKHVGVQAWMGLALKIV